MKWLNIIQLYLLLVRDNQAREHCYGIFSKILRNTVWTRCMFVNLP